MRLQFWEEPYDPIPDLMREAERAYAEIHDAFKSKALTSDGAVLARQTIRSAFESAIAYTVHGKDRKKLTPKFTADYAAMMDEWKRYPSIRRDGYRDDEASA